MNSLVNVKALTHFCFHFDLNIISHNLNDQVGAIIIAHHKMDDQIGAIERVDIYRQPLMEYLFLAPSGAQRILIVCVHPSVCQAKTCLGADGKC